MYNSPVLLTCLFCMARAARDRTAERCVSVSATGSQLNVSSTSHSPGKKSSQGSSDQTQFLKNVAEVLAWRRKGTPHERLWKKYVHDRGSNEMDPNKHHIWFLADFLKKVADGFISVDEEKPFGSTFKEDDNYETVLANMQSVSPEDLRAAEKRIEVYTRVPWPGTVKFTFKYGDDGLADLRSGWSDFALETFLSDGTWENEFDDSPTVFNEAKIKEKKEKGTIRAMTTNAFPASMSAKKAQYLINRVGAEAHKYLWPSADAEAHRYTLVHTFSENYNEKYKTEYGCKPATDDVIESENLLEPDRVLSEKTALDNFKKTVGLLLSKTYHVDGEPVEWDPEIDNFFERCVKGGNGKFGFWSEMAFVGYPEDLATTMKAHPTLFPLRDLTQSEVQRTANEFSPERGVLITHIQDFKEDGKKYTRFRYRKIQYKEGNFTLEERREFTIGALEGDKLGKVVIYTRRDDGFVFPIVKPLSQFYDERTKIKETATRLDDDKLWKKFKKQDEMYLESLKKQSKRRKPKEGNATEIRPWESKMKGLVIVLLILLGMLITMVVAMAAFFRSSVRT